MWLNTEEIVMTKPIKEAIEDDFVFNAFIEGCVTLYGLGVWGDTSEERCTLNDEAVQNKQDKVIALYKNKKMGNVILLTIEGHRTTLIAFERQIRQELREEL